MNHILVFQLIIDVVIGIIIFLFIFKRNHFVKQIISLKQELNNILLNSKIESEELSSLIENRIKELRQLLKEIEEKIYILEQIVKDKQSLYSRKPIYEKVIELSDSGHSIKDLSKRFNITQAEVRLLQKIKEISTSK